MRVEYNIRPVTRFVLERVQFDETEVGYESVASRETVETFESKKDAYSLKEKLTKFETKYVVVLHSFDIDTKVLCASSLEEAEGIKQEQMEATGNEWKIYKVDETSPSG